MCRGTGAPLSLSPLLLNISIKKKRRKLVVLLFSAEFAVAAANCEVYHGIHYILRR
jgi:hypothetical protein